MSIYTKKGDRGETGLLGNRRLPKTDPIFEVLGALDQANALTGLAVANMKAGSKLIAPLEDIQRSLLQVGSCLASEQPSEQAVIAQLPELTSSLEASIDQWDEILPPLRNFILPGGSVAAANLHVARTFVRQAERNFHRLTVEQAPEMVGQYLNRLSDYYFQAARYQNYLDQQTEKIWK